MKGNKMDSCKGCGFKFLYLEDPEKHDSWIWGCRLGKAEIINLSGCSSKIDTVGKDDE